MSKQNGWPTTDGERAELLREAEASGLSIRDFAERIGMSPHTLYAWRRRRRRRREAEVESGAKPVEFVELDLGQGGSASQLARPVAEVVLGPGVTVRVGRGFDRAELEDLLRVVLRSC